MKPSWSAASSSRPSTGSCSSLISRCPISCIRVNSALATVKRTASTDSSGAVPPSCAGASIGSSHSNQANRFMVCRPGLHG